MSFINKMDALCCKNKHETIKKSEKSLVGLYSVAVQLDIGDGTKPLSDLPRQLAPKKSDFLPQPHDHTSLSKYVHLIRTQRTLLTCKE